MVFDAVVDSAQNLCYRQTEIVWKKQLCHSGEDLIRTRITFSDGLGNAGNLLECIVRSELFAGQHHHQY